MKFAPEVEKAIEDLITRLTEKYPEVGGLLKSGRDQNLSPTEVMTSILQLQVKYPEMGAEMQKMAALAFEPLRDPEEPANDLMPRNTLDEVVGEGAPFLVQTGPGLQGLNPLYEAALAERVQFDGDIPEARTRPLLPGMLPAVPVETASRNMAAIGHMLDTASEEVMGELAGARQLAADQIRAELETTEAPKRLGGGFHKTGDPVRSTAITEGDWSANRDALALEPRADERFRELVTQNEPEGYRTGQLPDSRGVQEPSGAFLAAMTPEAKQEATWKALSTTQGRRAALGGITEVIAQGLANHGVELIVKAVPTGKLDERDEIVAYEGWVVGMSGPTGTSSTFSFIDTAGKALLAKLIQHDLKNLDPSARLEVLPINTVNVRQVGWLARIVVRK